LSEIRKTKQYRKFTAQQKLELCVASFRGDRSIAEICRENDISEVLLRRWREQLLEAGCERLAGKPERTLVTEQRKQIARLERALGKKTYELEIAGKLLADWE
jgi:transposase